jgi:hypothetical protein
VPPSAGAFYGVLVVLRDRRADQRDIDDLVGRGHPEIGGSGQVPPAPARALREQRHGALRALAPGQVRARRSGLLSRPFLSRPPGCCRCGGGEVLPGRSSAEGGIEEFPEFRETARSSLASRSASSAFAASGCATRSASAALCTASTPITCPCSAISPSRAASSGMAGTVRHHPGGTPAIKATR